MGLLSSLLDSSILFSFDRSGYRRHAKRFSDEQWSGDGKCAVVTGANSGIGFATVRRLLEHQVEVHLLCRSRKRGTEAVDRLKTEFPDSTVVLHLVDLADEEDVTSWLQNAAPDHVDILVNNAGGMPSTLTYTEAGHEFTWATHLLGHFSLTMGLLNRAALSEGSRVITVSSGGMYLQKLDLGDLLWKERKYDKYRAYANAKRAQVILSEIWHERFGPEILFSSMHPGWVDTKGVKNAMPWFYRCLGRRLRTPDEGADTIVWLALTPDSYRGGEFWFDREAVSPHKFRFTQESDADREALWTLLKGK